MKILIAKDAGYCFGVRDAVNLAYETAEDHGDVYMLGHIVHNENVVKDVDEAGAKVVGKLKDVPKGKPIMFRAHGTSTKVWEKAQKQNMNIIDATCPLVKEIHDEVIKLEKEGRKIIIIGDHGHDEVVGIASQIKDPIIVATPDEAQKLRKMKKAGIAGSMDMTKFFEPYFDIWITGKNIYFEARTESMTGKAAVGNVTKNRVLDKRWPSTYCEVVKYGPVRESWKTKGKDVKDEDRVFWPIKHRCQFSWYCDGKDDIIWANYELTPNKEIIEGNANAWTDAVKLAIMVTGYGKLVIEDNTSGALYYYNHNLVYPNWAPEKEFIGIEGNHTFMK